MKHLIKIIDTGNDYYGVEPCKVVLGRQYDNEADSIIIEIPKQEQESLCTMIITNQLGVVIDHIVFENNNEYKITSTISQNRIIKIGFSFSRKDGYVKNSAIIIGQFLEAQRPDGFVPVQPEQYKSIDYLIRYGFVDSKLVGNELQFFNANGEKVVYFDLSPFTQAQSDLGETDETAETFVKGKKTSNLVNDGENGTSPYATQEYVNSRKINVDIKMSDTSENVVQNKVIKNYVDESIKNVKIPIDTELSETSENPVQNKIITNALNNVSVNTDDLTISKTSENKIQAIGLTNGSEVSTFDDINSALSIERL